MTLHRTGPTAVGRTDATVPKLPMAALPALATTVFVTSLTETLPAGLLPAMSAELHVSEPLMGQAVTVYALATALTAVPLTALTARWPRRRVLLAAVAGFAVANTVTTVSSDYPLTMGARAVAGVAAGVAWALLAGYARGLAPAHLGGRAIAVAMAGVPIALSLGVPLGTLVGRALGWRVPFLAMTGLTVLLLAWITAAVPDRPGRPGRRAPMLRALGVPGVAPVLFVTFVFVLAHTVLYAYIAAFLGRLGMSGSTGPVLLVFGATSPAGVWIVGVHIRRRLRRLTIAATLLVAAAAAVLLGSAATGAHAAVYGAAALWGLGWGGVPTLLQTAAGEAGGEHADGAQAMLVTLWNAAMAGGGGGGGVLLGRFGPAALPWSVLLLLVPAAAVVCAARTHGFPAGGGDHRTAGR